MTANVSPHPLLDALRRATAEIHAQLDAVVQSAQPFGSMAAYATFLSRHLDARSEIVRTYGGLSLPGPWQQQADAVQFALHRDLHQLGRQPPNPHPSHGIEPPAGIGLLYALEGSLVGGQVQARQVTRLLGPTAPVSFLSAGANPRNRWPAALRMIESYQGPTGEALNVAQGVFSVYLKTLGIRSRPVG
jgi:heme oxygenase